MRGDNTQMADDARHGPSVPAGNADQPKIRPSIPTTDSSNKSQTHEDDNSSRTTKEKPSATRYVPPFRRKVATTPNTQRKNDTVTVQSSPNAPIAVARDKRPDDRPNANDAALDSLTQSLSGLSINRRKLDKGTPSKGRHHEAGQGSKTQASVCPVSPDNEGPVRVIPASVRPDGTIRKERRIRKGYFAPEERPRYVPPAVIRKQSNGTEADGLGAGGVKPMTHRGGRSLAELALQISSEQEGSKEKKL
ncbi:hypothetical protein EV182_006038 [Spiromyces aspiralis]|uniref:Uncharacterized protein n=1 Tax=Spiromyces aspiralis TaxID=68401 RepID=A0ACC1HQI4_9FUNG|nr:hypothetical protein EV182_006038 [Spiromyces aspiralis]